MESNKIQSALEYWHSRLSQECGEENASENVKPTDDETNVWYFLRKTAFDAIMLYDGYSAAWG